MNVEKMGEIVTKYYKYKKLVSVELWKGVLAKILTDIHYCLGLLSLVEAKDEDDKDTLNEIREKLEEAYEILECLRP